MGFQNASGFRECLLRSCAVQMIDSVRTDDCIECGAFEWELPHVSSLNCGPVFDASGLKIR